MIDVIAEQLLTLAEAAAKVRVHHTTIYRWVTQGSRGVHLDHLFRGGMMVTSAEALQRFMERVTESRRPHRHSPVDDELKEAGL